MKKINIFKAGKHTASGGQALSFSESDLQATIAAYDPAIHEAPIVIGHPKDNGPAYGWISSLSFSEDGIDADAIQVDPEFEEMVQAGRFKKRSASFYSPDSPSNPVPGVYYLRHVGFLGAQPPAVKGLKEVAFSDQDEGVVEFMDEGLISGLFRRLREYLISRDGLEAADSVIPDYLVGTLEDDARRQREQTDPSPISSFTEDNTMTPEQIAELQAKAARTDQLEAENQALTTQVASFSERETAIRRKETENQVQALIDDGRVLPADKDRLVEYLETLKNQNVVVEFGEGEAAEKHSPADFFLDYLAKQPKPVNFGEHDLNAQAPGELTAEVLAEKALEYRESLKDKGVTISMTQAVDAVKSGKAGKA